MVEGVNKLALDFINNLPNSRLDDIDKIYSESVTTEVGNIQTTDKGFITKKKSEKDAYITHPAVTPVKKLCVSQLDEGSPKKEKFESNVRQAMGVVRNKSSHAYKVLEEELEYTFCSRKD